MIPVFCIKAAKEWRTKYVNNPIRLAAGQECIDLVISCYREIPLSNENAELIILREDVKRYKLNSDKWLEHKASEDKQKKNSQQHQGDRITRLENKLKNMALTLDSILTTLSNPNIFVNSKVSTIAPLILHLRRGLDNFKLK